MGKKLDLIDEVIGNWRVLEKLGSLPNKGPHTQYKCICVCGFISIIPSTNLVRRASTSCVRCSNQNRKGKHRFRLSAVFSRVKKAAKKRRIDFEIDHDYVLKLMDSQEWKCALTKLPLIVGYNEKGHSSISTASLDRINSALGYVPGNVQWVYKCINMMKWKLSQREFIDMCKLVVENNP